MRPAKTSNLLVFLLAAYVINFPAFEVGFASVGTSYVVSPFLLLFLVRGIRMPDRTIVVFFLLASVVTVISIFMEGMYLRSLTILNVLIGSLIGQALYQLYGRDLSPIVTRVLSVVVGLHIIRDVQQVYQNGFSYSNQTFFFLTNGGPNIEVSVLGIMTCFIRKMEVRFTFLFYIFLKSAVYQSRAGVVIVFLSALLYFRGRYGGGSFYFIFSLSILVLFIFGFMFVESLKLQVFERFTNFDVEVQYFLEEKGRLFLWQGAMELLREISLFGLGGGRGVQVMTEYFYVLVPENNFHNIFLQYAVDLGVLGCFIFLLMTRRIFKAVMVRNVDLFFVSAGAVVIVSGMFQWTGYGLLEWMLISLALSAIRMEGSGRYAS
ncbi:O-antigen ligase family protein [Terasakiella pusilla]|uniref:O-antigen ligase family protein n=1 Tax=Terasakiella pusilla TaxID=64973 RepID=UPI003AA91712